MNKKKSNQFILVGDIGSTKANWGLIKGEDQSHIFETEGYNPLIHSTDRLNQILSHIRKVIGEHMALKSIYYYGTGIIVKSSREKIAQQIKSYFPVESVIATSDILGAAKALCADDPGVVCILGTGSNSCFYDGSQIVNQFPSLGYPLGDEGSGWQIGAALVKAFYYQHLPPGLQRTFQEILPENRKQFLEKLHSLDGPNQYLAKFAKVAFPFRTSSFIANLLAEKFNEFIDIHLKRYDSEMDICFVGSIAYYYKNILENVLREKGFICGKVIQRPIESLVHYHSKFYSEQ